MNEKRQIRAYVRAFKTPFKIIVVVLLLAFAASVFMAVQSGGKKDADPKPMDAFHGEDGSFVYVDVIGVSDWFYRVGNNAAYYLMIDADENFLVAKISDADLERLSAQRAWYDDDDEDAPAPEPVRLTGICKSVSGAVRKSVMKALELDEHDYDAYFGANVFFAGDSPTKNASGLWTGLAFATLVFALLLLLIGLLKSRVEKRALARLEQRALLSQAAADLNSPTVRSERKDRFRMSSRFLFGKGIGLAAAWDDVLWCYESVTRYNFIVTYRMLVICTADGGRHEHYFLKKEEDEIVGLMEYIQEQNPSVMLGYSLDNNRAYREQVKRNKA